MKKPTFALVLLCGGLAASTAMPTYYGLSGMTFLPGARIPEQGEVSMAFRSTPSVAQEMTIHPMSFSACVSILPYLELGLTNTYQYYMENDQDILGSTVKGKGFRADVSNIYAPVIPSAKLSFLDEAKPDGAIAIGFLYPLGTFLCFDYQIPLRADYCLYFIFGVGTTIQTLTPFLGARAELPFGVDILLEGCYSGMTAQLTSSQEVFFSSTVSYKVASMIFLDFTFRIDRDLVRRAMLSYEIKL
jgi:hypothetical protein